MLDFADRTGSSIFMEVWPQMEVEEMRPSLYLRFSTTPPGEKGKKVKRPTPFRFRGHPHPGSKKKIRLRRVWPSDSRLQIDLEVLSLQTQTHVHVPLPPAAEVTAGRQARGPECFSKSPQKEGSPSPRRRNM